MRAAPTSSDGYSLLELMVVLGILGLIAIVAAPTISTSIDRMTLTSDARDLATHLRALREDALDRQTEIVVAPSGAEASALTASSGESIELSSGTNVEVIASDGRARAGGRFVISADGLAAGGFRLSRGEVSSRLMVDRMSGRMSIAVER